MWWRLRSPASWLFTQAFIQTPIKTWKLHVTGLCEGNSSVTGEFPAQKASNTKNVSIWWRHHGLSDMSHISLSHHGMEMLSTPLAHCQGNPAFTSGLLFVFNSDQLTHTFSTFLFKMYGCTMGISNTHMLSNTHILLLHPISVDRFFNHGWSEHCLS